MSDIAIKVEGLGKKYRIGKSKSGDLRESFGNFWRRFKPNQQINKSTNQHASEFWALKDVSFEIPTGEAVGIIGRNGAGKSTLLKIISRITEPTNGRVELNGRVSSLLEVGTGFHPELSGRENIYLNGTILGMKRKEVKTKFDEIVAFSGVEKFIDTAIKHYSSGMKVRLAFSVAAHLEMEIMLIDEVLAVGDIEFQKKCLGKMENVSSEGRTVLFVSHQMDAIRKFCKRCFLIDQGKLKDDSNHVGDVIQLYIKGSSNSFTTPEWINKLNNIKNPVFIPQLVSIYSNGKPAKSSILNNSNNEVIIKGEVLENDSFLEIGYVVYNESGIPVYTTYFYDGPEEEWPKISKGELELRSQIPSRYLNEGVYKLELIVGIRKKIWHIGPGSKEVSLNFEILGGLSDSPIWHTKRLGVTAPVIKWYNK